MANSKDYASFVLLFAFLICPYVAQNMPESRDHPGVPSSWPRAEDDTKDHNTDAIDHKISGLKDPGVSFHGEFQGAVSSSEAKNDYFTNVIGYQPSNVKDIYIVRKNYKDGTEVKSHRKMMRPHEEINELRTFHAFPIKISTATNGDKTNYDGVRMEKVGDVETMN